MFQLYTTHGAVNFLYTITISIVFLNGTLFLNLNWEVLYENVAKHALSKECASYKIAYMRIKLNDLQFKKQKLHPLHYRNS